jgi:anti-sigma B factor antagonist
MIRVKHESDVCVMELKGNLELGSVEVLDTEVCTAVAGDMRTLLLDLRGLEFVDSSGIRLLLNTDARCRQRDLGFALMRANGQVARVLELTGVDERITCLD